MESTNTYSVENYEHYRKNGDKNYFEEVIDALMLERYSEEEGLMEYIGSLTLDRKRLAILSLLGGDNNLWLKIKALTDKNIKKIDHIKDIILMLREYVKVGEVEKKKFGEVMTPLELVKEMMSTLPDEVWTNPDLKWLDPANGTGPYPAWVIYRLMVGLKDWEPDEEKRYRHIVENMIYVCELQPKNMFLYMCASDPFDTYKLNIYTGSFIEKGFDYHMKNVWGVDSFDIVIGNPPYNKPIDGNGTNAGSIYHEFVYKSMNISKRLLFVIPLKWANNSFKEFRKKIISFGIEKITLIKEGDKIFSTTGVGEICFLSLLEKSNKLSIYEMSKTYDSNEIFSVSLIEENKKIFEEGFVFDEIQLNIIRKISKKANIFLSEKYRNPQLIKTNLLSKTNRIEIGNGIEFKVRKSRKEDVILNLRILDNSINSSFDISRYKVCFEKIYGGYSNNNFSNIDILEPGHITTEGISFFSFDSKKEAENFMYFINTDFCKFLRKIKQYDRSFTSMIFSYVPSLDFKIKWTDRDLYDYFSIELSEIEFIKKKI